MLASLEALKPHVGLSSFPTACSSELDAEDGMTAIVDVVQGIPGHLIVLIDGDSLICGSITKVNHVLGVCVRGIVAWHISLCPITGHVHHSNPCSECNFHSH